MTELNKARLAKPASNNFKLKPGTKVSKRDDDAPPPPPLLDITDEIARAAALVAEVDTALAWNTTPNSHLALNSKRAGTFWMEGITHKGTVPWGKDASYKVFRHVVNDYGADPTGVKDSTKAIQRAIDDGKSCGAACNGATTKNAIVYFPPGKYLVSSSISVYFGTQIIGDANNWPTIVAAPSFVGLGVLSTDVYVENGGVGPDGNALKWYINTACFYGQIRNLRIDITKIDPGAYVAALHYQTQQGMFAENGSGGVMSDITFTGGNFGIYGGAQQFSASRLTFNGNIREYSIKMAVPVDVRDSGFTGLVLDNVNLEGKIKDHWSSNVILEPGYYKNHADKSPADFVHLKDEGAKGDGSTDDTAVVQDAFNKYRDGSKIIFVDAGTYILKDIVTIPKDAKIIGETWSQFAANRAKFSDPSQPIAMFKVGNDGDVGTVEMQDLILTSKGPTPGVILI
ncbi:hypothetical protein VTI74DRAFT_4554 [Chaetomium olivicolor]